MSNSRAWQKLVRRVESDVLSFDWEGLKRSMPDSTMTSTLRSASGTELELQFGSLDLAFLVAGALESDAASLESLAASLGAAVNGSYDDLAGLVLALRQRMGQPDVLDILSVRTAGPDPLRTELDTALAWPRERLAWGDETHQQFTISALGKLEATPLLISGRDYPYATFALSADWSAWRDVAKVAEVVDAGNALLASSPAAVSLLKRYLAGERVNGYSILEQGASADTR